VRRRCFAYRVARNRHRRRIDGSAGRRKRDRLVRAGNEGLYGGLCPAVGHLLHGRVYEGNARAASAVGFALQDISPAARKLNLKGQLLIKSKADVTGKIYYELPSVSCRERFSAAMSVSVPLSRSARRISISTLSRGLKRGPPINRTFQRGQHFSLGSTTN
jgi:hypothetical protein